MGKKTLVLYRELWNFDLRRKKNCRLPKTKKLSFIMEEPQINTKKIEVFEQIYSFRTLINNEKNYDTMEKTMVLWKKPWYYNKF